MKKRKMKKYIPKDTDYCCHCKWWKHLGTNYKYLGECELRAECGDTCGTSYETTCQYPIIRCEYLGYTDKQNDSLLWYSVKECGVGLPKF